MAVKVIVRKRPVPEGEVDCLEVNGPVVTAHEQKVKVDLTMPPIQWGNDRSMRVALGGLLEEVASRAYNLARESADGVDG